MREALLFFLGAVGQDVARALQQVIPEEETPERVLNPTAHLHQVLHDVLAGMLAGLDVHNAHCDQEVSR